MDPNKLIAQMLSAVATGKILPMHRAEPPPYLNRVRDIVAQFRRAIGDVDLTEATEGLRPAAHAFADLLFDDLSGVVRVETAAKLKELPPGIRLTIEQMEARLAGKTAGGRWANELYSVKRFIDAAVTISPSGITREEIREGFHDTVHAVVDQLFDDRWIFTR